MPSNHKKQSSKMDFPFKLGDVVELFTRQQEHGFSEIKITQRNRTTVIKSGETKMSSPVMVVIEVVREDDNKSNFHDESTGKRIKDAFKACCLWFSHQTGQFHERWLNASLLNKVSDISQTSPVKIEINEVVTLKTALFANRQTSEELKLALSSDDKNQGGEFLITRSFDTLSFLPPKMIIVGLAKRTPMLPLFDKATGKPKRLLTEMQVKCMWYDYRTGKFSEHIISPDAIMSVSELPNEQEVIDKALVSPN